MHNRARLHRADVLAVMAPKIGERIYDGAVGSAGFLCEAYEYLKQNHPKRTTAQERILQERTFYVKEKKSLAYVECRRGSRKACWCAGCSAPLRGNCPRIQLSRNP